MTDLETRLAQGLSSTAERAPHPADLAAGARGRLRRRRRTAATVVAAAAAVVAIPVGFTVLGSDGAPESDRREPTASEPVPDDWRTETWRDLSVRVPPHWTGGSGTDWCAHDESAATATPLVSRPDRPGRTLGCAPSWGYGVHFFAVSGGELPPGTEGVVQQYRGRRYPYGAWLGYASTGQSALWVVTDSRTLTRQILDTAASVGEVDANGCAANVPEVAPSTSARVSVCRYDSGVLQHSELLSVADSRAAERAVREAGSAAGVDPACPPYSLRQPVVTMQSATVDVRLLPSSYCNMATVFLTGKQREKLVTEDLLYWALSPGAWWGGLQGAVPVPDRLRTD